GGDGIADADTGEHQSVERIVHLHADFEEAADVGIGEHEAAAQPDILLGRAALAEVVVAGCAATEGGDGAALGPGRGVQQQLLRRIDVTVYFGQVKRLAGNAGHVLCRSAGQVCAEVVVGSR